MDGSADYDDHISSSITCSRWLQLKRVIKLCNNDTAPKFGEPNYNPAYKYNLIYDVLCHNVNAITHLADLDLCGDETTWGHQGFGERGSGILQRIAIKPHVTKGGQVVMVCDIHRIHPHDFIH